MLTYYIVFPLLKKYDLCPSWDDVSGSGSGAGGSSLMNLMRIIKYRQYDPKFVALAMVFAQLLAYVLLMWLPVYFAKGMAKAYKGKGKGRNKKFSDTVSAWSECGAVVSCAAIGLTLVLNFMVSVFHFFWAFWKDVATSSYRSIGRVDSEEMLKQFTTIVKGHLQINAFGDCLFYLGVLIVWAALLHHLCARNKDDDVDVESSEEQEDHREQEWLFKGKCGTLRDVENAAKASATADKQGDVYVV